MHVVIAGGHGKIALHLERLLVDSGHRVSALIRNRDQDSDVREAGAEPVICDLEHEDDLSHYVSGAGAVVFAAGAGPGSGPERKRTVDLGGALKLIDAARRTGVRRYVMVSSIGAEDPSSAPEQMRPYQEAKAEADQRLAESGLDWTIVRPGRLTDEPGTGLVTVTTDMSARGDVPREDVARVLAAVLGDPGSIGKTFVLLGGDNPVDEAVAAPVGGAVAADAIAAFLREIGVPVVAADLPRSFLPGVAIKEGTLLVDEARLEYPGDMLHEAGHLAVAPPDVRDALGGDIDDVPGLEWAVIPWSYAAAVEIGIDPAEVFHGGGYRGHSPGLLRNFELGVPIGLHHLVAAGMTTAELFPRMLHWLRK